MLQKSNTDIYKKSIKSTFFDTTNTFAPVFIYNLKNKDINFYWILLDWGEFFFKNFYNKNENEGV